MRSASISSKRPLKSYIAPICKWSYVVVSEMVLFGERFALASLRSLSVVHPPDLPLYGSTKLPQQWDSPESIPPPLSATFSRHHSRVSTSAIPVSKLPLSAYLATLSVVHTGVQYMRPKFPRNPQICAINLPRLISTSHSGSSTQPCRTTQNYRILKNTTK